MRQEKRILNLGCGHDFYGTDRLDFAETGATTKTHDLNKPLPFSDETFDEVKAYAVFEHLKNNGNFVNEIYRVLKKGGKVDLTTCNAGYIVFHTLHDHNDYLNNKPEYMKTRHSDDYHRHLFVPSHLKAWFKDFKNVEVKYLLRNKKGIKKFILWLIPFKMGYEALHLTAIK